jgi:competence protein ComEC
MKNSIPALPLAIALLGGAVLPNPATTSTSTNAVLHASPTALVNSPFAVHFLDVGTGDSAIIDIGPEEVLIDGGDSVRVLTDYVARTGIVDGPIELVIVTHADTDHWRGLTRLLGFDGQNQNPAAVLEFWEPGYNRDCRPLDSYETFIDQVAHLPGLTAFRRPLEDTHPPALATGRLDPIVVPGLPDVKITLLSTDSDPPAANTDCAYRINDASIVFTAEIFGYRFLFTGDANGKERDEAPPGTPGYVEKRLLAFEASHAGTLKADVIKVPHHGSETANTQAFIDKVDPDFVVISASTKHHLPKGTVVERYTDGKRVILRTDDNQLNDTDHIVCFQNELGELDCNYEKVLSET